MADHVDIIKELSAIPTPPSPKERAEGAQLAIQPFKKILKELDQKLDTLQKKYADNPDKYANVYKATQTLSKNLKNNLEMYTQKKIGPLTFIGLNHLHINQAQPILEKKVSGLGSKFFRSIKNVANRFLSSVNRMNQSIANESTDFQEKMKKLKALLRTPNQEKLATYLVNLNPSDIEVITTCHQIDSRSIKDASPAAILKLMEKMVITPTEAIQLFPDNEEIIEKVEKETRFTDIRTEQEVIKLIKNGQLNPLMATKSYPNHLAIVEAAYKQSPESIINANRDIINQLGEAQVIKVEDVLNVFSKTMPTPEEVRLTAEQYKKARANKNWRSVAEMCHKFWFEKPKELSYERVVAELSQRKRWQDLYNFEQIMNAEDYQLTYGPLQKSPETYELEELARIMMQGIDFTVETIGNDDYFVFTNGEQFNWTKIRANADLQHINLQDSDFELYKEFMYTINEAPCKLFDEHREHYYQKQLYKGQKKPEQPINFQQMQAINIYTGKFYKEMNGLMRDEVAKHDYRSREYWKIRDALVHSVICASGLRMLPVTNIKESYRGASFGTNEDHIKRVHTAAHNGVMKIDGFVSSSTNRFFAFNDKPVFYTFKNLRGAYIAPISQNQEEGEFLIPPTQIQLSNYKQIESKHQFEGIIVSEPDNPNFTPLITDSSALSTANPKTITTLIKKGSIPPERAVKAFPNDREVVLAAYSKAPDSIQYASASLIESIEKEKGENKRDIVETFAILNTKLLKIKNAYLKEEKPNENFIRELSKAIYKTPHLSEKTKEAVYVMDKVINNKDMCEAFGIDYTESKEVKMANIEGILQKGLNDEPLFVDEGPDKHSMP